MTTCSIIFYIGIVFLFAPTPGHVVPNGYLSPSLAENQNEPWTDTKVSLHKPFVDLEDVEFDTSDGSFISGPDLPNNIFPDDSDSSDSDSSTDDDLVENLPYLNRMAPEDEEVRRALDLRPINKSKSGDHAKKKENNRAGIPKAKQTPMKSKQKPEKPKNTGKQRKTEYKKGQNGKKNLRNLPTKKSLDKPKVTVPVKKPQMLKKNLGTGNNQRRENRVGGTPGNILRGRVVVRWKEESRKEIEPSVKSQLLLFLAHLRKDIAEIEPVLESSRSKPDNSTDDNREKKVVFNVVIAQPKNLLPMERDLTIEEDSSEAEIVSAELSGIARDSYEKDEEEEEGPAENVLPRQDKRPKKTNAEDSSVDSADDVKHKRGRHEETRLKSLRGGEKKRRKPRPHQSGLEREIEKELAHGAKKSYRKKDSTQSSGGKHVPTIDHLIAAFDDALPPNQSGTADDDNSREDTDAPVKSHLSDRDEPRRKRKGRMRNHQEYY